MRLTHEYFAEQAKASETIPEIASDEADLQSLLKSIGCEWADVEAAGLALYLGGAPHQSTVLTEDGFRLLRFGKELEQLVVRSGKAEELVARLLWRTRGKG